MYAIRSYYEGFLAAYEYTKNNTFLTWAKHACDVMLVITSYSIHYTKLYDHAPGSIICGIATLRAAKVSRMVSIITFALAEVTTCVHSLAVDK